MPIQTQVDVAAIILIYLFVSCAGLEGMGPIDSGSSAEFGLDNSFAQSFPIPVEEVSNKVFKRFPDHFAAFDMRQWVRVGVCPEKSSDGNKLYYCPSLTPEGNHACVDDHQLCNGMKECPNAEDENRFYCFFYRALKAQVDNVERSVGSLGQIFHSQQFSPRARKYGKKYYY